MSRSPPQQDQVAAGKSCHMVSRLRSENSAQLRQSLIAWWRSQSRVMMENWNQPSRDMASSLAWFQMLLPQTVILILAVSRNSSIAKCGMVAGPWCP
jgi:hypothetical protein